MYHLMSHLDLDDGVLYPMGGFTTLIDAMHRVATSAGVEIRTGADVVSIDTEARAPGRSPIDRRMATVRGVTYRADGTTTSIGADIVVSAADLHHTETTLLPADLQTYPEKYWDKRVPGPSALLLYLGVRGGLPQLEHHTLLFTTDWRDNFGRIFGKETSVPSPASLYVCRPSATDGSVAPDGHENVFVLVPIPADVTIGRGGVARGGDARVEELADTVIGQIAEWAGIPDLAERIVVRRSYGPPGLRRRPQRVARHLPRAGAHPEAERVLPRLEPQRQGGEPILRGKLDRPRDRDPHVPHQRGAHRQAAAG
ncbi:hypothetical protein MN0502_25470 [Arthrobacter sp. MN05-02]|nr:hypothetical protein MN0502_25470 [Arthrobacter sp. MN05-02]